jgi:ELP3 family radical SAM enzyme/protein acetyltransferase
MACLQHHNDIESLYLSRDKDFQIVLDHLKEYTDIVFMLYDFYNLNKNKDNFKKMFERMISSLGKHYKFKVTKVFLVYVYQKMIKQNNIANDSQFWLCIQKCPSRNLSGVNSFALLLSPNPEGRQGESCKHNCYYCPDETRKNGAEDDMPRSYLKKEPAVQRGFMNGWDACNQMNDRMNSLMLQGHEVDKLEIIIEGGTYTEFPMSYLLDFHRDIFYSANTFFDSIKRTPLSIEDEMYINKTTKVRIIGICIETRPDAIDYNWIKFFRKTGTTRIQLGVQHIDNYVLKKINRGHTFEQSCDAVDLLKNNCFKVDIHLMPDLPNSTPVMDKHMFLVVFNTDVICPDQVKIYPCEVTPYTVIEKWYKNGTYIPYSEVDPEYLLEVIQYAMKLCPPWVRVPRVVRDIPISYIQAGNKISNLRQKLEGHHEMRSREIARHPEYYNKPTKYFIRSYKAGTGMEYFISLESLDKKVLFGFLRLRLTRSKPLFDSLQNMGLIRELHVYNHLVPVGYKPGKLTSQHKGIGKQLLKYAEWISWIYGKNGVAVISGEGVRAYYNRLGYKEKESFEIKIWINLYATIYLMICHLYIMSIMIIVMKQYTK